MLDGVRRTAGGTVLWDSVEGRVTAVLKVGKCKIEAAVLLPVKQHLATCAKASSYFGMRVRQVGAVYAVRERSIVGRIASGKRGRQDWVERTS